MNLPLLTLAAACAFSLSCERHDFEGKGGTKQLQQSHGAHHAEQATHGAPNTEHDKGGTDAP